MSWRRRGGSRWRRNRGEGGGGIGEREEDERRRRRRRRKTNKCNYFSGLQLCTLIFDNYIIRFLLIM